MSDVAIVPVTFSYEQQVFPTEGHGKIQGCGRQWLATRDFAIPGADPEEVEAVVELAFDHGGSFAILRHRDAYYRPVFAPGTHEACDLATFAAAASGVEGWRDCPLRRHRNDERDRNVEPTPFREGRHWPDPENWRKLGPSKEVEAHRETAVMVSDLLVVDGIVHRRCEPPVLVLKSPVTTKSKPADTLVLAWSMDRLESDDHPLEGPVTVVRPDESRFHERRGHQRAAPDPNARYEGPRVSWAARPWRVFGLDDVGAATRFGEAYAAATGARFLPNEGLVTILREWAVPDAPRFPLERIAKEAYGKVGDKLRDISRESVNDWLDARDAKGSGDVRGMLDAVARVLARPEDSARMPWKGVSNLTYVGIGGSAYGSHDPYPDAEDAMAGLLRYDVVERHRVVAAALVANDEEALASMSPEDADLADGTGEGMDDEVEATGPRM